MVCPGLLRPQNPPGPTALGEEPITLNTQAGTRSLCLKTNHLPEANLYFRVKESLGGIRGRAFRLEKESAQWNGKGNH